MAWLADRFRVGHMPDEQTIEIDVVDHPEAHRYEARDRDGTVLGFSQYRLHGDVVVFTHTCLLYTSPSPRDLSTSRMPSSA